MTTQFPAPGFARESARAREETARAEISVIVPLSGGPPQPGDLYRSYAPPLRKLGRRIEFLFVGSLQPDEAELLRSFAVEDTIRVVEVARQLGPAAMLRLALEHSEGDVIISLPLSFRVAPGDLPQLVQQVDRGSGVAVARRHPRVGGWLNRIQAVSCNWLLNALTGAGLHDITCRTYAMRREVLAGIPLYGGYFRFLPVLAQHEGYRVDEVGLRPHPASHRTRVYFPNVYLGWLIDILGLFFLIRFTYRPLRFFGLIGGLLGVGGGLILVMLVVQRFAGQGIANRPLLVLGVLLVTLGVQFIALGLIGEIVVHFQAARGATYRLRSGRSASEGRAQSPRDPS